MPTPDDNRTRYDVEGLYTDLDIFQLVEIALNLGRRDVGIIIASALHSDKFPELMQKISQSLNAIVVDKQSGKRYSPTD